jgi:ribonuclease BN (tRNA processing enzyme)
VAVAGLRFLTLGVGNAFSALYYSSSVALEAEGAWLLLDCPHPVRKMVREASEAAGISLGLEQVSAVVLTHLHADHCSGLEDFIFYLRYAAGRRTHILAHPDLAAPLWQGHLAAGMEWSLSAPGQPPARRGPADFYDLTPLHEAGETPCGPFAIRCRPTIHSVPTTALLVRAGGRCLGYSADTAFDPGLIDWLSEADLIIHETGTGGLHTPYADLAALPSELRARMRLIHYPDDFDLSASTIEPLRQRCCYSV